MYMESSVRIGQYIFSVDSDNELAAFIEAAEKLKEERKKQKEERSRAAAEILTMIGQFVDDYGQLSICNEAGEIFVDSYNISAVTINWDTKDD